MNILRQIILFLAVFLGLFGTANAKKPAVFETLIEESSYQSAFDRKIDASLLSLQMGKTSLNEFKRRLQNYTPIVNDGINPFTKGAMLTISSKRLGVDLMREATFIFNEQNIMTAVLFTMDKGGMTGENSFTAGFDKIYHKMSDKYPVMGIPDLPANGDKSVKFMQDHVAIEMDSAKRSDVFEIRFLSREFRQEFATAQAENNKPVQHAKENHRPRLTNVSDDFGVD